MEGYKSYILRGRLGIDDLQCEYAWTGNSQGDTSATNNSKEGLSSQGWMSFNFEGIDPHDQDAINEESKRRKHLNEEYIRMLKMKGEYGKEIKTTIHLKHNPIFDGPMEQPNIESSKMIFLNNTKHESKP